VVDGLGERRGENYQLAAVGGRFGLSMMEIAVLLCLLWLITVRVHLCEAHRLVVFPFFPRHHTKRWSG
jgi:hypothetical protein